MFGIGVSELLVIFFVALVVLGPERLPSAARTLAKIFGEFRRATDDLRSNLVGISDIDEDWRREHNNPRIVKAETVKVDTIQQTEKRELSSNDFTPFNKIEEKNG